MRIFMVTKKSENEPKKEGSHHMKMMKQMMKIKRKIILRYLRMMLTKDKNLLQDLKVLQQLRSLIQVKTVQLRMELMLLRH